MIRGPFAKIFAILSLASIATIGSHTASAQATEPDPPKVLLVVDTSGSMSGSRLAAAKQALSNAVGAADLSTEIGLASFAGSCGTGKSLLEPIAAGNRASLQEQISQLVAGGGTPTPSAIRAATETLKTFTGDKILVLVSDGQSSCGDPCFAAQDAKAELGIEFQAITIGFQAPGAAETELQCIATATDGQYYSVDDSEALALALSQAVGGGCTVPEYPFSESQLQGYTGNQFDFDFNAELATGVYDQLLFSWGCLDPDVLEAKGVRIQQALNEDEYTNVFGGDASPVPWFDYFQALFKPGVNFDPAKVLLAMALDMDDVGGKKFRKMADFKIQGLVEVGTVIDIDVKSKISPLNAPVIVTEFGETFFRVSTIEWANGRHILAGTREWGYQDFRDSSGYVRFYTRGISHPILDDELSRRETLKGERKVWERLMEGLIDRYDTTGRTCKKAKHLSEDRDCAFRNYFQITDYLSAFPRDEGDASLTGFLTPELEAFLERTKGMWERD